MKYWTKRKISSAYRAIIMVPVGALIIFVGIGKANGGEEGSIIIAILGAVMFLLGCYYAYDLLVGANKEKNKVKDAQEEIKNEQKQIRDKMRKNPESDSINTYESAPRENVSKKDEPNSSTIPTDDLIQLKKLNEDGIITDDEFSEMKKKLLKL